MLNIGLVGLGFMAATHIRAYRQVEGAHVAALCNPSGRHLDGDFTNVAGNVGATDPVVLEMVGVKATRHFAELLADPDLHAIDMSYTVNFERATADYDIARGKEALKLSEEGQPPRVVAVPAEPSDGYVGELRHFVECIRNGKAPSVVTAADGLASIEICEAEERSVNTRQIVTVH